MRAHCDNASALAVWLDEQSWVERVHYSGLPGHAGHALSARQQRGFGGVLAFEVEGGQEAAWRFINGTHLMSLTANLGDAKTTIVHPATTTHGRLSSEQSGCVLAMVYSHRRRLGGPRRSAGRLRTR